MFHLLLACTPEEVLPAGESTRSEWSGEMHFDGTVEIAADEAVFVLPGAWVEFGPGAKLIVNGTLTVMGKSDGEVNLWGTDWEGVEVNGTLQGNYLWLSGPGATLRLQSGTLTLTDSFVNTEGADCISVSGGTVQLDHMFLSGPLLIEQATSVTVTGSSINQGPAVRLAQTDAVFVGNNLAGPPGMQDVGGGITAEIGGNYWGGEAPVLETDDPAQFTGADDWVDWPFDTGPR